MATGSCDVAVVGGGVIGSAIAWRCAQRGLAVCLVDPDDGRGAWRTAAGMLAPVTELHYTETPLLSLNLASLARYRDFAAEAQDLGGLPTGYRECGTVTVAWDGADLAALQDLQAFATGLGLRSRMLTGRELRALEPGLAAGLPGGLLAEDDHQVDPRLLHAALRAAAANAGVERIRSTARPALSGDRVRGLVTADGTAVSAPVVVIAAGAWSAHLDLPETVASPRVRPVKGQTLRLRLPVASAPEHVVRGTVKGSPIYLVPRADGEIVVGASSEEAGFDQRPRAGAVYELLRDAQSVFPELGEAVFSEVSTGLRPGSPDNAPLIGPAGVEGLVYACGHYRNGVLLTPVTADAVAELVATGTVPELIAPFLPARFDEAVATG